MRAPRGAESETVLHPCAGVVDASQAEARVTLFDVIPIVGDELEIGADRYSILEIERTPLGYACRCGALPGRARSRGKTIGM